MPTFSKVVHNLHLKMVWAEKHLKELNSVIVRDRSVLKHPVTEHDDLVHGRHIRRVYNPPINIDIPLTLGDCVYSMRSCLDHLAWQLAHIAHPIPSTETLFPIHASNDPKSEARFLKRVKEMPADAVVEIRNVQPYQRGAAFRDDPLWKLNELSNIEKHRIVAVSSLAATVVIRPLGYTTRKIDNGLEFSWPIAVKDRVVFEPYAPEFVFGKPIDLAGDPVEVGEREIAEIHRYVRDDVIPRFTRFFA
jgi:hypothetical protein